MENINVTETNATNTTEQRSKLIFNASLMKYLIEEKGMANQLIGLKANRDNRDRCVFVMIDSIELRDAMQEYTKMRRATRAERAKAESEEEVKEPIEQED